ncbi:MAG: hypothetical protein IJU86_01530 [Firmicutes bacterium]|nr:hypothetical protein [Bacillota bacterium]
MVNAVLVDTKLILKFADQNYYNSDINNLATNQNIYDFVGILTKYFLTAVLEIQKTQKYELVTSE